MNTPTDTALSPFSGAPQFETAQRVATALSASSLVPAAYQGRDKLPNVLIALEIANRIGASPLSVMQSLHVIQGRPSWSASFLIATVNACGRFTPLRFEVKGDDPHDKAYRVRAISKDKDSGETCEGPWITWKLVELEGWDKKPGSKWKSMPELMFLYRAAAFWTRVYAPELSLGIHTAEEIEDIGMARTVAPERSADLNDLEAVLRQRASLPAPAAQPEPSAPADDAPPVTFEGVQLAMENATSRDELDEAADLARFLPDADQRAQAAAIYSARLAEMEMAS